MMRVVNIVALAAGAIAFSLVVDRLGWGAIEHAVLGAGWWFLWIALIDLASVFSDSAAVYHLVRAEAPVSYWRVFAAQASGIAINRLTPANSIGEAIKVTMLLDHAPKEVAVSAIVKFNVATLYVAMTVVVLGVPLTTLALDLPDRIEIAVWGATAALVGLLVILALLLRRGAITTAVDALRATGLVGESTAARWTARIASIDASIASFGTPHARRGVAFVMLSRVFHSAATILVLHAAAVPFTPPVVIAMLSVGILVTWLAGVVPLGIGLADGGNYFLYGALGSSGIAGLAFTMVNRTRVCVLAAMGLVVLAIANLVGRGPASAGDPDALSSPRTAPHTNR